MSISRQPPSENIKQLKQKFQKASDEQERRTILKEIVRWSAINNKNKTRREENIFLLLK
jgi:hypothetical protein